MILLKVMKNFLFLEVKILFLDGRRGQGLKSITRNINKPKITLKTFYKPILFKPVECMDTIHFV